MFFLSICVHFIRNRFCQFHGNYLVLCVQYIYIHTHMCKQKKKSHLSLIGNGVGERFRALLHWFHQCSFWVSIFASKQNHTLDQMVKCGSYACVCSNCSPKKKAIAFHILFVTAMSSIWYFIPLSFDEEFRDFCTMLTDWRQRKFNENVCHFDSSINVSQRQRRNKKKKYPHTIVRKLVTSNQHKCQPGSHRLCFFFSLSLYRNGQSGMEQTIYARDKYAKEKWHFWNRYRYINWWHREKQNVCMCVCTYSSLRML